MKKLNDILAKDSSVGDLVTDIMSYIACPVPVFAATFDTACTIVTVNAEILNLNTIYGTLHAEIKTKVEAYLDSVKYGDNLTFDKTKTVTEQVDAWNKSLADAAAKKTENDKKEAAKKEAVN